MAYLNKVMLIGNLGKDPEIRLTANNRKRATFSLATSRRYRDSNGEMKEQTEWHNIVVWGKQADIIEQLGVHKGSAMYVEGSIIYRSWDDQNGQKRYSTDIWVDTFQLLSPRDPSSRPYNPNSYQQPSSYQNAQPSYGRAPQQGYGQQNYNQAPDYQQPSAPAPADDMDDDLPF